ncbi:MAG: AtzE family amidohydrolase, partial [Asticcacaulis sp.]|nr:AtzE family amidohydrolase [Asticcacaulis sp.]
MLDRYNALTRRFDRPPGDGMTFVAKDLFDIAGLPTTAGAKMRLDAEPATRDAEVVARLKAAGMRLVGTANMDEYAYGFATVNAHFGTTRNPHDLSRLAGGSSGGSAAAVAGGLADFSLGSDTNGSIRVPASLCGIYGMRPALGDLPIEGAFPLVYALDTVGPFTRSVADLKCVYEIMAGREVAPAPAKRVAVLGGFFERNSGPEARSAVRAVAAHLDAEPLDLREAEAARSAAFLITAA